MESTILRLSVTAIGKATSITRVDVDRRSTQENERLSSQVDRTMVELRKIKGLTKADWSQMSHLSYADLMTSDEALVEFIERVWSRGLLMVTDMPFQQGTTFLDVNFACSSATLTEEHGDEAAQFAVFPLYKSLGHHVVVSPLNSRPRKLFY